MECVGRPQHLGQCSRSAPWPCARMEHNRQHGRQAKFFLWLIRFFPRLPLSFPVEDNLINVRSGMRGSGLVWCSISTQTRANRSPSSNR